MKVKLAGDQVMVVFWIFAGKEQRTGRGQGEDGHLFWEPKKASHRVIVLLLGPRAACLSAKFIRTRSCNAAAERFDYRCLFQNLPLERPEYLGVGCKRHRQMILIIFEPISHSGRRCSSARRVATSPARITAKLVTLGDTSSRIPDVVASSD